MAIITIQISIDAEVGSNDTKALHAATIDVVEAVAGLMNVETLVTSQIDSED